MKSVLFGKLSYRFGLGPQPSDVADHRLVEAAQAAAPGRALDLGSGTGRNAIWLARHGWDTTGVEMTRPAVAAAERRASAAGVHVRFVRGDVTRLPELGIGDGYSLIMDGGCYHMIPPERRGAFADGVTRAAGPGALLIMVGFTRFPGSGMRRGNLLPCFRGCRLLDVSPSPAARCANTSPGRRCCGLHSAGTGSAPCGTSSSACRPATHDGPHTARHCRSRSRPVPDVRHGPPPGAKRRASLTCCTRNRASPLQPAEEASIPVTKSWPAGQHGTNPDFQNTCSDATEPPGAEPGHPPDSTLTDLPQESLVIAYSMTVADVNRSATFYSRVLGGSIVRDARPVIVQIANTWLVLNAGGGPTDDKPLITLQPPQDLNTVSSFLNIRVGDIASRYRTWRARGAEFITEPKDHGTETRCYLRDPDGYLIEVGQAKPR